MVDENKKLKSLAPTSNAERLDIYNDYITNALEETVDDSNELKNKNIAISGSYGSGKSSIISSYFNKNNIYKDKVLFVSLASYIENNDKINLDELELTILQQIIYSVQSSNLPLSRIDRIDKDKNEVFCIKIKSSIISFLVSSFVMILFCLFNFDLFAYLSNCFNGKVVIIVLYFILFIVLWELFEKIFINFKPKKVSLTLGNISTEVEKEKVNESILNKHVDELLYLFKNTDYRFIVFEDIERLEQCKKIFSKLKETNMIINNALKNKTVQFIYAVNDTLFENSELRTKFFDIIIPIVPYSSSGNVKEILLDEIKSMGIIDNIQNIVNDIYFYIPNVRFVYDIVNEYNIYLSNLYGETGISDGLKKQLLCLSTYKVLYPKKFLNLEKGKGIICYYFSLEFEREFIDYYISEERDNRDKYSNQLKKIKTGIIDYSNFCGLFFKHRVLLNNNNISFYNTSKIYVDKNEMCSVCDFVNNPFDYKDKIKHFDFVIKNNSSNIKITKDKIFSEISEDTFWEYLDQSEKKVNDLNKKIKNLNNKVVSVNYMDIPVEDKINYIESDSFSLPNKYVDSNDEKDNYKLNSFEKQLIRSRNITSNCLRLIGLKHKFSLTLNDIEIIELIKNDDKREMFDVYVENPNEVISNLSTTDFYQDSICISSLFCTVLTLDNKYEYLDCFFNNLTTVKIRFLVYLLGENDILFKSFNKAEYVNEVWKIIEKERLDVDICSAVVYFTIKYVKPDVIEENSYFYDCLQSNYDVIKYIDSKFDDISENLNKFDIVFDNDIEFTKDVPNILKWMYENKKFSLNISQIKNICNLLSFNYDEDKILESLFSNDDDNYVVAKLKEDVDITLDYIEGYNKIQNDNEDVIIKYINDMNMSKEQIERFLKLENVKFTDIKKIGNYDLLQELDKIGINYNNLNLLFEDNGNRISEYIMGKVEENIDNLCKEDIKYINYKSFFAELYKVSNYELFKKLIDITFVGRHYLSYNDSFSVEKNEYLIEKGLMYSDELDDIVETLENDKLSDDYKIKYLTRGFYLIREKIYDDIDSSTLRWFCEIDCNKQELVDYLLEYKDIFDSNIYDGIFTICLNDDIVIDSDILYDIIVMSDVEIENKIALFIKYNKKLRGKVCDFLLNLGGKYAEVISASNRIYRFEFENNSYNEELAKILIEEKIIKAIDKRGSKIYFYRKEKRKNKSVIKV